MITRDFSDNQLTFHIDANFYVNTLEGIIIACADKDSFDALVIFTTADIMEAVDALGELLKKQVEEVRRQVRDLDPDDFGSLSTHDGIDIHAT